MKKCNIFAHTILIYHVDETVITISSLRGKMPLRSNEIFETNWYWCACT